MSKIQSVHSREILDSRGIPTIETTVLLENGMSGVAAVPSGTSTGTHEALELRDQDPNRYHGEGVLKAIQNIHEKIRPVLTGKDVTNQSEIDTLMIELDGTKNKERLGANSILSVSLSCARVSALVQNIPLYRLIHRCMNSTVKYDSFMGCVPLFNVINGGLHAGMNLDFQEFMIIPRPEVKFPEALRQGAELNYVLKTILQQQGYAITVGYEGGFAPSFATNKEALSLLRYTVKEAGYRYGLDIKIGLDLAASTYYTQEGYRVKDVPQTLSESRYVDFLLSLQAEFDISIMEDPINEDSWDSWVSLTSRLKDRAIVVGDDLLVTNKERLQKAIDKQACTAIIVKLNQVGTLTETLDVIKMSKAAGMKTIISHRSGETTDDFIADLAVGTSADFVKFGATTRGERVAKYNRLLKIYEELTFHA